ncbi:hypothetical protein CLIB1444_04S07074 [[Candida] jaroonii]|uniref:Uncharacterized protein n=1 Tax=[Candida] jaroonii TaxID=467808 RepID=A0ACA9Y6Y6_9ASCO|nr:hypothetical protein CLIB1444_04S07074 [[Candida] jaroonii]
MFEEAPSQDYPLDVYKLLEIMPDLSIEYINVKYEECHHDFDMTLNNLVGVDKLKIKDQYDIKDLWTKLGEVTGIDTSITRRYLEDNEGDYIRALIQLVSNEVKLEDTQTSRIQRGRKAKVSTKSIETIHKSDPQVRQLDLTFCKKLMTVLGDLEQALVYVEMICDFGYQELTFHKQIIKGPILKDRHMTGSSQVSSIKLTGAAKQVLKEPKTEWITVKRNYNEPNIKTVSSHDSLGNLQSIGNLQSTGKLDLHGFTSDTAVSIVAQVTNEWWDQELDGRLKEGKRTYGKKAEIMEPLKIITGRGIHSKEGYSKIKLQVGRYLNAKGYVYEEQPGNYTVIGKK